MQYQSKKNAVSDRKYFFPISNVDGAEFMKTFFCSFVSYFVCLVFFLDISGHCWRPYQESLENEVIVIYLSQQRCFK